MTAATHLQGGPVTAMCTSDPPLASVIAEVRALAGDQTTPAAHSTTTDDGAPR
jgi:hypothetical protein